MELKSLANQKNFEIWNDYGKIIWPGVCDISYQNFDEILDIRPMEVDMYEDNGAGDFFKPLVMILLCL